MYDVQGLQSRLKALAERLGALEVIVAGMDAALCGYDPDDRIGITEAGLAALNQDEEHEAWLVCPSCCGRGSQEAIGGDTYIPCSACDGTGIRPAYPPDPPDLEEHERAIGLAIASDEDDIPF